MAWTSFPGIWLIDLNIYIYAFLLVHVDQIGLISVAIYADHDVVSQESYSCESELYHDPVLYRTFLEVFCAVKDCETQKCFILSRHDDRICLCLHLILRC